MAWIAWVIVAAVLGVPLVVTTLPEFGMFGIGALAAALTAGLGAPVPAQVLVFVIVSVALVAVLRPVALRHLQRGPRFRSGIEALPGKSAVVLERVDGDGGRIKLAGEVWSARALDGARVFEPGERVDVAEIQGATAIVM